MAYRLDPAESVPDGVRRIAHEQLTRSIRWLTEGTHDRDEDVHSARKAMKRMRALVRLVRAELGTDRYRLENETFRDSAQQLAGLRDATVLVATLDALTAWAASAVADFAPLRDALEKSREEAYSITDGRERIIEDVAEALSGGDRRVDDWPLRHEGSAPVAGLLGVYRRGRAEFDEVSCHPSVENLHQWRKRVKYLWYHTQILESLWPGPFIAWQAELDRLGDLLGDDHDLALLADVAREEPTNDSGTLLGHIGRRRHQLQAEALALGVRIYSERPRDLRRRVRGYWSAWSEERLPRRDTADPTPGTPAAANGNVPERVADSRCRSGEGPLWHEDEQRLYWVDTPEGRLCRYDPASGAHAEVFHGEPIGGFTVQVDGSLLLFMARGAVAVWREGQPLRHVVEEIPVERDSRFNDAIADPEGRVFCGTMPGSDAGGRLYRLDTDGTLTELLDEVGVSHGMGFTPDCRYLYSIDSAAKAIWRFDYDRATGELSKRRMFVKTGGEDGVPDGMTVDTEGCVWCARRGGSCLVRYRPDGTEERRVWFPARKVSGVGFGGDGLDDLYVTTAGGQDRSAEGEGAGALFRLRPGVSGAPTFRSRVAS